MTSEQKLIAYLNKHIAEIVDVQQIINTALLAPLPPAYCAQVKRAVDRSLSKITVESTAALALAETFQRALADRAKRGAAKPS